MIFSYGLQFVKFLTGGLDFQINVSYAETSVTHSEVIHLILLWELEQKSESGPQYQYFGLVLQLIFPATKKVSLSHIAKNGPSILGKNYISYFKITFCALVGLGFPVATKLIVHPVQCFAKFLKQCAKLFAFFKIIFYS